MNPIGFIRQLQPHRISTAITILRISRAEHLQPKRFRTNRVILHCDVENYTDFEIELRDESRLFRSAAKVQVYSVEGLIHELRVSSSTSNLGYFWDILRIDGVTKEITILNQITRIEPPSAEPGGSEGSGDSEATYFWSFGDGTTSIEANPKKIYSVSGTYSVNLTVHQGGEAADVTKEDFMHVTPRSEIEEELEFTSIRAGIGRIVLEWTGGGTLQMASKLEGLWDDVTEAISPHAIAPTQANVFFRIRK